MPVLLFKTKLSVIVLKDNFIKFCVMFFDKKERLLQDSNLCGSPQEISSLSP